MRKFFILMVCALGSVLISQAQNATIVGVVVDSLGKPVELANVMAYYASDSTVASFGITDSDGRYKLVVPQNNNYVIKSSFIGYETWVASLSIAENSITHNILLKEQPKMLNEVEIKYDLPITVNGDTVTYKADQFTTGKERKLGNVLEALPGFEIDDNGDIKVQGKKVDKVLVEGKEFFDGDTKMATQNIPASAVDKIQLLRDYNDVSPLSGLGTDESLAINVKLEEGKERMWFGDVEAAAGPQERYLVHPNVFYYSPKMNVNLIADANNIGKETFSLMDYFRFTGGMRRIGRRSGSNFQLTPDEFGMSLMQNNRARYVDSKMGALNFNYQPNKKWRVSGYGIGTSTMLNVESFSQRTYLRDSGDAQERTTSNLDQINGSLLSKLSATYTPTNNLHVGYEAFLKASSIEETDVRTSNFGAVENELTETDYKDPFSLEQILTSYYTINKRNVMSFETSWNYKRQIPRYQLETQAMPFNSMLPLMLNDGYNIRQAREITTNTLLAELNHYFIINKTNHINFSAGLNGNYQQMVSSISQLNNEGIEDRITDQDFNNNNTFNFSDYYLGLHYKTKLGKLVLSPGLSAHLYDVKDNQLNTNQQSQKTLLTPDLFMQYKFGSSESVTLNYNLNAEFTDVQNMASGLVLRNYNSAFYGNRNLENSIYHQFNLNYFNYNMFNHTNLFLMANYQKRYNQINESVSYSGTDRLSSPSNIGSWNDTWFANASFEKRYVWLKIKSAANVSFMTFENRIEGQVNENSSLNQEYRLSVESKFTKAPNVEIGIKEGWNIYNSNSTQQEYLNTNPYIDVEAYFLKHFAIVADYQFNNYRNMDGSTTSNYDFLNASLYFQKKDSPWEFKMSGNNLLQTKEIRQDAFNDNLISTFSYYVQPRYFLFSIKYNI